MKFRKMMGCIALGLTCAMIGAGATMAAQNTSAAAEAVTAANSTTTVVTSPFTAAVQQVRNSVVGVSNYQTVRYGSYGNNFYFGYGFGYGNGRNNDQQIEEREELAATGSGVVIGQGFVLTNYHVVEDASSLRVTVTDDSGNTDEYAATLVAYDESLDIAIVYARRALTCRRSRWATATPCRSATGQSTSATRWASPRPRRSASSAL